MYSTTIIYSLLSSLIPFTIFLVTANCKMYFSYFVILIVLYHMQHFLVTHQVLYHMSHYLVILQVSYHICNKMCNLWLNNKFQTTCHIFPVFVPFATLLCHPPSFIPYILFSWTSSIYYLLSSSIIYYILSVTIYIYLYIYIQQDIANLKLFGKNHFDVQQTQRSLEGSSPLKIWRRKNHLVRFK